MSLCTQAENLRPNQSWGSGSNCTSDGAAIDEKREYRPEPLGRRVTGDVSVSYLVVLVNTAWNRSSIFQLYGH